MLAINKLYRERDNLDKLRKKVEFFEHATAYPPLKEAFDALVIAHAELKSSYENLEAQCAELKKNPVAVVPAKSVQASARDAVTLKDYADKVSLLEEQLIQLREILLPTGIAVPDSLSRNEATVLRLIASRTSVTHEAIFTVLYIDYAVTDLPNMKIIDVIVCNIRKKLKPYDISIETIWGEGYRMSPADKAKLSKLV